LRTGGRTSRRGRGLPDPVLPDLGRRIEIDNRGTRVALGMTFIPVEESATAIAQSLIDRDLVCATTGHARAKRRGALEDHAAALPCA
jgi:hypothetical protein